MDERNLDGINIDGKWAASLKALISRFPFHVANVTKGVETIKQKDDCTSLYVVMSKE